MTALTEGLVSIKDFGLMALLPAILIFALLYGILTKTQILGENEWVNVGISAVVAILFIAVLKAVKFTQEFLPLIAVVIVVIVFVTITFKLMGIESITSKGGAFWIILLVIVLSSIIIVTLKKVSTPAYGALVALYQALTEPVVLAMIVMFGTFIVAAVLILRKSSG